MGKKTKTSNRKRQRQEQESLRRPLLGLAALGALAGVWAVFLWFELLDLRRGGEVFCALGGTGCASLWDHELASATQRLTRVPVAGWGVIWGLVGFLVPVSALRGWLALPRARAALSWIGLGGSLGLVPLLAVSLGSGQICSSCLLYYAIVLGWTALAYRTLRPLRFVGGLSPSLAALVIAYLAMLPFGLRTPLSQTAEGRQALAGASAELRAFLEDASPRVQQAIADSLEAVRRSRDVPLEPVRGGLGDPDAPLRITDFVDIKCNHCKDLHETLTELRERLPEGAVFLETRQYPLDGNCNPHLAVRGQETVRCTAARALSCLADRDFAFDLTAELFSQQAFLDDLQLFHIVERYVDDMGELRACLSREETERRLRADIQWATRHGIRGTPMVLVNGRKGTPFGPFLYALALAGGDPEHPAFEVLPAPDPTSAALR